MYVGLYIYLISHAERISLYKVLTVFITDSRQPQLFTSLPPAVVHNLHSLGVIVFYSEEENMPRVKYAEHGRQKAEKNSWELNCCMVYLRDVTASCELTYVFLASSQRSATAVRDTAISAVQECQLVC